MSINRQNYETFFLLYVDNELSAADRKTVDLFVKENPDLQTELELLLETNLPAENITYELRHQLYKNETDLGLLQEDMLLYLDNELDPVGSKNIGNKIFAEDGVKKEWEILQQTKLDANDRVVFKHKKLLYRHEKARVVSIRFWRVAVAAAIIAIMLFSTISILKKDGPGQDPLVNGNVKQILKEQDKASKMNKVNPSISPLPNDAANITSTSDKQNKNINPIIIQKKNILLENNENTIAGDPLKNNKDPLHKVPSENINREDGNETVSASVLKKRSDIVHVNKAPVEIANSSAKDQITAPAAPLSDYNSVPPMPDSYVATTAFNDAPENNNQILYMNEDQVSRTKVGGLFRKVKRVVERNTNIKTGKGFKIGGFAIALK